MQRKNKLYGGTLLWPGENAESRVIVCAPNRTTAAGLIGTSQYVFDNFFSETGNKVEIEVAGGQKGVWVAPLALPMKAKDDYKHVESRQKETTKKVTDKRSIKKISTKASKVSSMIDVNVVAEDIIKLKFKPKDTLQSCFDQFYAIMRKYGIKKGVPIRQGKKIIGTQGDSFAWTMCRNLFQDQVHSWIEMELVFGLDIPLPKDLEC